VARTHRLTSRRSGSGALERDQASGGFVSRKAQTVAGVASRPCRRGSSETRARATGAQCARSSGLPSLEFVEIVDHEGPHAGVSVVLERAQRPRMAGVAQTRA
jgi:hypothetical protein